MKRSLEEGDYIWRETIYRLTNRLFYSGRKDERMSHALQQTASVIYSQVQDMSGTGAEEGLKMHNITKVEYSARLFYLTEANRKLPAMFAASMLYLAALVLIAIITFSQTIAVITAAGWC